MRGFTLPHVLKFGVPVIAFVLAGCGDDGSITTNPIDTTTSSGGTTTSSGGTTTSSGGTTTSSGGTTTSSGGPNATPINVAGSVTGLAGTGLAISLNGGAAVGVTGSSFSLGTVKDGESFNVTVTTQPSNPAQTCTVENGSGTARAGANVDVRVTCKTNLYTVGGKVTGLVGTGLVLKNNGELLPVAPTGGSDVSFTFPTKIASGAGYAITIETSPVGPTETCSVDTKGAGTVGAADVTDVEITCSPDAFTVGGVVKGLQGSGLELRINNQSIANLFVAGNASGGDVSFTAPSKIASGGSYVVTVEKQPRFPEQTCLVEATGPGRVTTAKVTSIVVSCTTNTYSVGGNVTGLQGTGLVLRNNGQNISIGGGPDVPFTFPNRIPSGGTYAITVETNPAGPTQTCSVDARGAGTVTNVGVTNVVVTCSSSAYALGGRVKNINPAGAGITLRNGGQTLFVPPNSGPDAPFTFPTKLASGSGYAVSVEQSPFDSCIVVNPTGSVSSADVTTIEVSCTPFAPPTDTLFAVGGLGHVANVALDGSAPTIFAPPPTAPLLPLFNGSPCFDGAGNVYHSGFNGPAGGVRKLSPTGTTLATFLTTGVNFLHSCVVDAGGNLILSDTLLANIKRMTPDGTFSPFGPAAPLPQGGIARIQGSGDLFLSVAGGVMALDATGAVRPAFGVGGTAPLGAALSTLALDSKNNLYIVDTANGVIQRINAAGTTVTPFATIPAGLVLVGLATDSSDNLYSIDFPTRIVKRITPAGVFSNLATLPDIGGLLWTGLGVRRVP